MLLLLLLSLFGIVHDTNPTFHHVHLKNLECLPDRLRACPCQRTTQREKWYDLLLRLLHHPLYWQNANENQQFHLPTNDERKFDLQRYAEWQWPGWERGVKQISTRKRRVWKNHLCACWVYTTIVSERKRMNSCVSTGKDKGQDVWSSSHCPHPGCCLFTLTALIPSHSDNAWRCWHVFFAWLLLTRTKDYKAS